MVKVGAGGGVTRSTTTWPLGLVVGKFSPLHRGHEHVIAQAMDHCERVLVLGYSQPEWRGCEGPRRQAWVARRFPQALNVQIDDADVRARCHALGLPARPMPDNHADDDTHQAWLAWLLDRVLQVRPHAMFGSESYLAPTCLRLSETFGHTVTPVIVDIERAHVPVRATDIRRDVHAHRWALSPDVYQDFVRRVAFLGGESTGKTTLAQAMARHSGSIWVPEYGRERWEDGQGQLSLVDLIDIARVQLQREQVATAQARDVLWCDTTPLTTLGYAGWMFDQQPEPLQRMAAHRYDLLVLCDTDIDHVQDGTRQDPAFRQRQQAWYRAQLQHRSEPVVCVQGTLPQRIAQVMSALERVDQPMPPFSGITPPGR